jgi:hypothetical protein
MVTLYVPGWSCNATNLPSASVVYCLATFVSTFRMSTDAPASAPPLASITVP